MSSEERPDHVLADADLHLAELVNRVLDRGAVITGEITISVAGVDLIFLGLQLVISAAENARHRPGLMRSRVLP
jgi:gas vesicle structural protein